MYHHAIMNLSQNEKHLLRDLIKTHRKTKSTFFLLFFIYPQFSPSCSSNGITTATTKKEQERLTIEFYKRANKKT